MSDKTVGRLTIFHEPLAAPMAWLYDPAASGGSASTQCILSGDAANILLQDDGEGGYADTGAQFGTDHNWTSCLTGGYVIGPLKGAWEMKGQFLITPTCINAWNVTNNRGSDIGLILTSGQFVGLDLIPESTAMLLFGSGLIGPLGFRRKLGNGKHHQ